ncbi:MAG: hypothetical protein ACQERF_05190 [Actinomycetota bacterium]
MSAFLVVDASCCCATGYGQHIDRYDHVAARHVQRHGDEVLADLVARVTESV